MFTTDATRVFLRARRHGARAAGFVLALLLVVLPAVAGDFNITGYVFHVNGQPAASATVKLQTASGQLSSVQTDGSGAYAISASDPNASTAVMWAEKGGLSSPTTNVLDKDITSTFTLSIGQ